MADPDPDHRHLDGMQRWIMSGRPTAAQDPDLVWQAFCATWDRVGIRHAYGRVWFAATGQRLDPQDYGEKPGAKERQEALDALCWTAIVHAGTNPRCLWCVRNPRDARAARKGSP